MNPTTPELKGQWRKATESPCAEQYPDRIDLRDGGLYFGEKDPPGSFTTWDAGTWEVSGEGQIKLSTANDAVIVYQLKIIGEDLIITDKNNCEISYRRA